MAFVQQPLAQVRPQEPRPAADQNTLGRHHHRKPHAQNRYREKE
jgi:hypothetical protein